MKLTDNKEHPFTAAPQYSPLMQRVHFMFGNLSRVDVRLNTDTKKPYCNWFCRDQEFILSAAKLPLYGVSYFPMLYAIWKGWAQVGQQFIAVNSDDDIDELMRQTCPV